MTGRLIARANRVREGDAKATPIMLWRMAEKEAVGRDDRERVTKRRRLYAEAMIHSGLLLDRETGSLFATCPFCGETLGTPK